MYSRWVDMQNRWVETFSSPPPVSKGEAGPFHAGPCFGDNHLVSSLLPVDSLESYRNVTVALFSRYFLYCPTESHAATYKWHHNGSCIQNCSTHWPCFHFIENVTHDRYGRYTCISEENGFSQTLVREWLLKQPKPSQTLRWKSQAVATSPSFWLGFLQVMALALLFQ